jgi:large subunit ribosomal protein L10
MNQTVLQEKQKTVDEIADKISKSGSTVVVEYRGLSVKEITELRRALREQGCEMDVYKNSLTRRAAEKLGYDMGDALTGPNAIAVSPDEIAASHVLAKFAKKHDALIIKSGIVDNKVVSADEIKVLATLPNKEGMLSMLLSCLQSPISAFARAVQAVADAQPAQPAAEQASAN